MTEKKIRTGTRTVLWTRNFFSQSGRRRICHNRRQRRRRRRRQRRRRRRRCQRRRRESGQREGRSCFLFFVRTTFFHFKL